MSNRPKKYEEMTLTQLEKQDWGSPEGNVPPSIGRCYDLRKVPLNSLGVEDMRLLIGQGIGLEYLVPLAIKVLDQDPLAHGEHYFGDLLVNVLRVDKEYFSHHPEIKGRIRDIVTNAIHLMDRLDVEDYDCTSEALSGARKFFE